MRSLSISRGVRCMNCVSPFSCPGIVAEPWRDEVQERSDGTAHLLARCANESEEAPLAGKVRCRHQQVGTAYHVLRRGPGDEPVTVLSKGPTDNRNDGEGVEPSEAARQLAVFGSKCERVVDEKTIVQRNL